MEPYRILSLDGGGAWALLQVKALKKLFGDIPGRSILQHFDLVAANSGGSIVAAALAENKTPTEMEQLFLDKAVRKAIFSKLSFWERSILNRLIRIFKVGPRYSAQRKLDALRKHLPEISEIPMYEIPQLINSKEHRTHFLIAGYDYYRNRSKFFRTNTGSAAKTSAIARKVFGDDGRRSPSSITMIEAVHISSNAPINYFDQPAVIEFPSDESRERDHFWDGAIGGYNNPVLSAVTEALCNGVRPEQMWVLSIGTGSVFLPMQDTLEATHEWLYVPQEKPTFVRDLLKMTTSILGDPPDAATFVSYTIMFPDLPLQRENFIRLNPMIQPVIDDIDGQRKWVIPNGFTVEEFQNLIELDMDATEEDEIKLIQKLGEQWLKDAIPNQPVRNDGHLNCLIGHSTFGAGQRDLETWQLNG